QKVAVLMKNGMEMITVIHALSYVGAGAVLLNTRLSREELLWQMEDAEVVCLVTDQYVEAKEVPVYPLAEVMNEQEAEASIQEE
ncbi:AMP-binding protein, partial [Bacillus thuringiensis]|uniref:AMP-binding protein n=1 Tax=Bacillus thuringiensis TaxID=1428 RepID=UPI00284DC5B4